MLVAKPRVLGSAARHFSGFGVELSLSYDGGTQRSPTRHRIARCGFAPDRALLSQSHGDFGFIPQRPNVTARSGAAAARRRPRRSLVVRVFLPKHLKRRRTPGYPGASVPLIYELGPKPLTRRLAPSISVIDALNGVCEAGCRGSREVGTEEIGTRCFECHDNGTHLPCCRALLSAA